MNNISVTGLELKKFYVWGGGGGGTTSPYPHEEKF